MTRKKLSLLGLSALALVAVSALVVTNAQGEGVSNYEFTCFETEENKLPGDPTHEGKGEHVPCLGVGTEAVNHGETLEDHQFDTAQGPLTCNVVEFSVLTDNDGTSSTGETEPTYKECSAPLGIGAEVTTNECTYDFHIEEKTTKNETEDEFKGTSDLTCPEGKNIEIHLSTGCIIHVFPQETIGPMYFRNMTHNTHTVGEETTETMTDITVEAGDSTNGATVKAVYTGNFFTCGTSAGEHTTEYTGNTTVRALNEDLNQIDLSINQIP